MEEGSTHCSTGYYWPQLGPSCRGREPHPPAGTPEGRGHSSPLRDAWGARWLKQSQRQREAWLGHSPAHQAEFRICAHLCACVMGTNMQRWCTCLNSWMGSLHVTARISPDMGWGLGGWRGVQSKSVSICQTGHLPPGQKGSHTGDTNSLSPGAHLPERQEPLPRHPPEIRWARMQRTRL